MEDVKNEEVAAGAEAPVEPTPETAPEAPVDAPAEEAEALEEAAASPEGVSA